MSTEDKDKAWKAYVAGYMAMANRQVLPIKLKFEDLNEKGQAEVRTDFETWWLENNIPPEIRAKSEPLGTPCPHCGKSNTKLLFIGDPPSERKREETKSMGATVVVETGATLGACDDCRQTWFLDNQS